MALKKYSKVKFKFVRELAYILIAIVLMITVAVVVRIPSKSERLFNSYKDVNASLVEEHVFEEVSKNRLTSLIANSSEYVFVYYGSPSCSECVANIETFNQKAKYWDIKTVYYLNASFATGKNREDDNKHDAALLAYEEVLNKKVSEGNKDISLNYTPSIWVFKDGELVFNSQNYMNTKTKTMELSWVQIADRAFSMNKPAL